MTSRERVKMALNHKEPDRVPIHDTIWPSTLKRWKKEGLPEDISPSEYFGFDFEVFSFDQSPQYPVKIIEETETHIIRQMPYGAIWRDVKDFSSVPEIINWPIKTKDDWKEIKKHLKPNYKRVDWVSELRRNSIAYNKGKFCVFWAVIGYDELQRYMKSEEILIMMKEDPIWIREMIEKITELVIDMFEIMEKEGFNFDGVWIGNDMGYRNGLLYSPETYMDIQYKAEKELCDYFHSKGMKVIIHSDGNIKELIPILIEVGYDCLQPLEVKAGMDVIELKEKYGDRISFMGGIDVRKMADPEPGKIEEEIKKKFEVAKKGGGYIYHSDHTVPKNVSFKQYCYVIELVKKYGKYEKNKHSK